MDTRSRWQTSSSNQLFDTNFYTKKETISDVQYNFDIRSYNSAEGSEISIINDYLSNTISSTEQVLIQDFTNPLNEYREDRKIHLPLDSKAKRGSYVVWDNRYWMILTKVESNEAYYSAKITETNNMLKWKNKYGKIISLPCFYDDNSKVSDFDYNTNITLLNGKITIYVQYNSESTLITENDRFLFNGKAYKVTRVNNHIQSDAFNSNSVTLLILEMVKDEISTATDDVENNIANAKSNNYTITINQGTSLQQVQGYTNTLTTTIKNDDTVVTGIETIWTSSDTSIVTVESNGHFILSSTNLGTATLTVSLKDNPSVSATYTITVTASPSQTPNIVILPDVKSILQDNSQTYTCVKTVGGINSSEVLTIQDITTGIPSGYYTISIGSNTFTINNIKMYSNALVKIKVSDNLGNSKGIDVSLYGAW